MRIVIIGGGLSGLAAGYRLCKKHEVTVLEKDDIGGMAASYDVEWDGKTYPIAKTYHHILDGDEATIRYIKELGLQDNFLRKRVKQGFIYKNKIWGFSTPLEVLRFPLPFLDKIRLAKFVLFDTRRKEWDSLAGKSAKEWVEEKAGKRNYEVFFDQLIRNKFHMSGADISAPWLGTRLVKESTSFLKKFGWLDGDVGQIAERLVKKIEDNGGIILYETEAVNVDVSSNKVGYMDDGKLKILDADVIISTMAPELFLKIAKNMSPTLKQEFSGVDYLGCLCLTVGSTKKITDRYWVNVLDKNLPFSAVFNKTQLYQTSAPVGKQVFYIVVYLNTKDPLWGKMDQEITDIFIDAFDKIVPGFKASLEWKKMARFRYAEAIYSQNFKNPPIKIGNVYFAGIYRIFPKIRNMASALESGEEAAKKIEDDINE